MNDLRFQARRLSGRNVINDILPFPRIGRNMTADTTNIGVNTYIVSASGSSGRPAWQSLNINSAGGGGDNSLGGWAHSVTPSWYRIQFPLPVISNGITMVCGTSYHPTAFTIWGSLTPTENDWVQLFGTTVAAGTWPTNNFDFFNQTPYLRYEIRISSVRSAEPTQWSQFGFLQWRYTPPTHNPGGINETPPITLGLIAHYTGSSFNNTTKVWNDISPGVKLDLSESLNSGDGVTQGAPLNSLPTVVFAEGGKIMSRINSDVSIKFGTNNAISIYVVRGGSGNVATRGGVGLSGGFTSGVPSANITGLFNYGNWAALDFFTPARQAYSTIYSTLQVPQVASVAWNGTLNNTLTNVRFVGRRGTNPNDYVTSNSTFSETLTTIQKDGIFVGGVSGALAGHWVAEVLIYNVQHTQAEQEQIVTFLRNKYGL